MKKVLLLILTTFLLISCKDNIPTHDEKNYSITKTEVPTKEQVNQEIIVDKIHIGMTIQEMKDIYKSASFIEEPVYEYGIDGESNGLVVQENGKRLFFVWTMQNENKIKGITILSKDIKIDNNISVGMTLEEFIKKYPKSTLAIDLIDDRYEFIYVPELKYRIEFLTTDSTRIAEYDFGVGEPEFIKIKNPKKEVDRISLK